MPLVVQKVWKKAQALARRMQQGENKLSKQEIQYPWALILVPTTGLSLHPSPPLSS